MPSGFSRTRLFFFCCGIYVCNSNYSRTKIKEMKSKYCKHKIEKKTRNMKMIIKDMYDISFYNERAVQLYNIKNSCNVQ